LAEQAFSPALSSNIVRQPREQVDTGVKELLDQNYPSTLESVDEAEVEILKAAEAAGFDEDERHRIGMAVRECMVNAVVHGNRYNRNKQGFEREEVPDPLNDNNLLRHSGRGLFLMGAFMDDVRIRKVAPSGTEVALSKKVGPRA
jgi:serine/threonine-protein kinase RsbW